MRRRLRTETTIETHQVTVIRKRGGASGAQLAWCGECCGEVSVCTPEEAAIAAGVSARKIYSRVEAGQLHFSETSDGGLLICVGSLSGDIG